METQTNSVKNQQIKGLDGETEHQLKQQLKFTAPALDAIINFIPQTRLPILSDTTTLDKGKFGINTGDDVFHPDRPFPVLDKVSLLARQAIEAKAKQLQWVGVATSIIDQIGQGYIIRYEAADIYYSAATGAHEVHGDIRAKYNAFGAANGVLGLPMTDETGTPDGIGRFNHFQGGSIYWTIKTGPMMVRGAIRDMWAAQGWENSAFGYPIADEHRKVIFNPVGNPPEFWSKFQNGAIYSKNNIAAAAVVADIAPQDLTNLVRKTFDQALKDADSDLGIEGGVNVLNISDWSFGFWESQKRTITYEIHGFYSNGIPGIPDPTFRLELQFLFGLTWENTFTEPINKTLIIYLKHWKISTSGVGNGELFDNLVEKVPKKFPFPVQLIPAEALLIDILVTPQGGLNFLLEPNVDFPPIGEFRRNIFQTQLNSFIES